MRPPPPHRATELTRDRRKVEGSDDVIKQKVPPGNIHNLSQYIADGGTRRSDCVLHDAVLLNRVLSLSLSLGLKSKKFGIRHLQERTTKTFRH
jgi:hypothetical protein